MGLLAPSIFRFEQAVAATTWNINHNLGSNGGNGIPIVDVYSIISGDTVKVVPRDIIIIDKQNVQVVFSNAMDGFALVIC